MAIETKNDTVMYLDEAGQRVAAKGTVPMGPGTGATATDPKFVKAANWTPRGYVQMLSAALASSAPLPATIPAAATIAIIENNGTTAVRWRDDGGAPTASVGGRIAAGGKLTYDGSLSALRLIYEATGAILDISYYS